MSLAATQLRLAPAEALAAVTVNAAHVLGRADTRRSARARPCADIVLLDAPDWRHLAYHLGGDVVHTVVARASRPLEPRGTTRSWRRGSSAAAVPRSSGTSTRSSTSTTRATRSRSTRTRRTTRMRRDGRARRQRSRSASRTRSEAAWPGAADRQRSARRALIMALFFFAFLYVLQRDAPRARSS